MLRPFTKQINIHKIVCISSVYTILNLSICIYILKYIYILLHIFFTGICADGNNKESVNTIKCKRLIERQRERQRESVPFAASSPISASQRSPFHILHFPDAAGPVEALNPWAEASP